ncbi:MAG: HK97 family phage prohead protease [Rhodoblastus sp.]|nr:HK97 family phage prohead protease [Rhodoblastus sp.]
MARALTRALIQETPRALTRALARAPESKRAPLALGEISVTGLFEGYASLFGVADLGGDVVLAGAFRDSLRKRGPDRIKMLWQHDPAQPIGAWLAIEEDSRGLKVNGRLNLDVSRAREILALMREGQVDGLSIGFRTLRATQDSKTGLRHLQKLDLWEISLVTFPMLPQARVTQMKSDRIAPAGAAPRHAVRRRAFSRDGASCVR